MGSSSPNEKSNRPKEIKTTGPKNYSYCFKERELSCIKELKEQKDQDIKNGTVKGEDNFFPLFRKVELDLTAEESIKKNI